MSEAVRVLGEVDVGGRDGWPSETGVDAPARQGVASCDLAGREQQVVALQAEVGDAGHEGVEGVEEVRRDVQGAGLVVFGVGLDDHPLAGGGVLL